MVDAITSATWPLLTRRRKMAALAVAALLGIVVAAYFLIFRIPITEYSVPERVDVTPSLSDEQTVIVTSVGIPLRKILSGLEQDIPRRLWSIDQELDNCVPRREVRIFGQRIRTTPSIGCTLRGNVRRGRISLSGRGDKLIATFPINASVAAEDIGGIIKRETATGSAVIELTARFLVNREWQAGADVDLSYRWIKEPGIDFLGQRIRFTGSADQELEPIVEQIERNLESQIQALDVRSVVDNLWTQGFTTESLNAENPSVWLRLEPKQAGIGSFRVANGQFAARVMLQADTRIVVGARPDMPSRTPLGENMPIEPGSGFNATIPVFADYAEVEPVILRALRRLAAAGIEREGLGRLEVEFEKVTLYPTNNGKIAIGITAEVQPVGRFSGDFWNKAKGEIWLTAMPVTHADSKVVSIRDLEIFGDTDTISGDLLLRVMASSAIKSEIERALVEDFNADYQEVIEKARAGLSLVRLGNAQARLSIDSVTHGRITAVNTGLFMPVKATGSAAIQLPR